GAGVGGGPPLPASALRGAVPDAVNRPPAGSPVEPGGKDPPLPGTRSATRAVPAAVPSLCQASKPPAALLVNQSSPLAAVRFANWTLSTPGSNTSCVPNAVPSVRHSVRCDWLVWAAK